MTIRVRPLAGLEAELAARPPARLLSLLSPGQAAPTAPAGPPHLVLRFHDVCDPGPGLLPPTAGQVEALLAFGAAWGEAGPLLVHCWMGVSRSPAAAFALACQADPGRSEAEIAASLRRAAPHATPNPRLLALADAALRREGRLQAAGAAIGRGAEVDGPVPRFDLPARPAVRPRPRPDVAGASAGREFTTCSPHTAQVDACPPPTRPRGRPPAA